MPSKLEIAKHLINLLPTANGGKWIIDGGCHIGRFSLNAIHEFPTSNILAFEPDPESWALANNNIGSYERVEIVQAALGATKGQAEFFRGPVSVTNSLLPRPADDLKQYYPEQASLNGGLFVDVATIDEECDNRGINELDLLKLDLQGGELLALNGATTLLGSGAVKVIIIEAVFVRKYQNQPLLWELWRNLETSGYTLYSLEEIEIGSYQPEETSLRQGQWNQCDAIFISESIRSALDKQ